MRDKKKSGVDGQNPAPLLPASSPHTPLSPSLFPLKQVQEDISAVQGAMAAGLRIEFSVDPDLTGIVIGKKVRPSCGSYVVCGREVWRKGPSTLT